MLSIIIYNLIVLQYVWVKDGQTMLNLSQYYVYDRFCTVTEIYCLLTTTPSIKLHKCNWNELKQKRCKR